MKLIVGMLVAIAGLAFSAPEEKRTGCVMQTEAGWFTFCEPNFCSAIKGVGIDAKLAGHKVTVMGTVQAETSSVPKTFVVNKVVAVGAVCDERCSPRAVGHRGLGNHDKPGAEGGTPGAVPTPKVPPPLP